MVTRVTRGAKANVETTEFYDSVRDAHPGACGYITDEPRLEEPRVQEE